MQTTLSVSAQYRCLVSSISKRAIIKTPIIQRTQPENSGTGSMFFTINNVVQIQVHKISDPINNLIRPGSIWIHIPQPIYANSTLWWNMYECRCLVKYIKEKIWITSFLHQSHHSCSRQRREKISPLSGPKKSKESCSLLIICPAFSKL